MARDDHKTWVVESRCGVGETLWCVRAGTNQKARHDVRQYANTRSRKYIAKDKVVEVLRGLLPVPESSAVFSHKYGKLIAAIEAVKKL